MAVNARSIRTRCETRYPPRLAGSTHLIGRLVVQVGPEPAFDLADRHAFARVVVLDLIAIDLAEAEVTRLRVSEVEAAHARAGPHRARLGEHHAGVLVD